MKTSRQIRSLITEEAKLELGMLQFMSNEIKNRVSESSIITIDLEKFYPKGNREFIDMSHWLDKGLVLREKEFRRKTHGNN